MKAQIRAHRPFEPWADLSSPLQADACEAIVTAVESGEIPSARIRNSVGRLLRVTEKYDSRGPGRH
jgi:hypothetical protein